MTISLSKNSKFSKEIRFDQMGRIFAQFAHSAFITLGMFFENYKISPLFGQLFFRGKIYGLILTKN
jgi:hypothetical protein